MSFAVKQNETFDSVDVTLLRAQRIMLEPEQRPRLIKQFRLAWIRPDSYSEVLVPL